MSVDAERPNNFHLLGLLTNREQLQAELAHAEQALLAEAARVNATFGQPDDSQIESARNCCRRIRAEFNRLDRLVEETIPPGKIEGLLKELRELRINELTQIESLPNIHDSVRGEAIGVSTTSAQVSDPKTISQLNRTGILRRLFVPASSFRDATRQGFQLLLLIAAYLAYQYVNAQLEIAMLPSAGFIILMSK